MSHPWPGPGDVKLAIDTYRYFRDQIRYGPGKYDEAVRASESMRRNFERLEEMYDAEGLKEAFESGRRVGEMGPNLRELARLSSNPPRSNWKYAWSHGDQKKMRELTENLRAQSGELREYMGTIDSQNLHYIRDKVDHIEETIYRPSQSQSHPHNQMHLHQHRHHHHHHHHSGREVNHHYRPQDSRDDRYLDSDSGPRLHISSHSRRRTVEYDDYDSAYESEADSSSSGWSSRTYVERSSDRHRRH